MPPSCNGEFHSIYTAPGPRKKEEKKKDILFSVINFIHEIYSLLRYILDTLIYHHMYWKKIIRIYKKILSVLRVHISL